MVKAPADKGGTAEEALGHYFRAAGFFTLRGVPFRHDGEDLTDIDVWLYERGGGLQRRRYIVDAKYKAKPKTAERLLWTSGLRDAVGIDGAFVAATNVREANRRLAKRLSLTVLDFQALGGGAIGALVPKDRIFREDLLKQVGAVDKNRENKEWRAQLDDVLASALTSFGGSSTNVALRAASFFAHQVISSQPQSVVSALALRLFYLCASVAAASLDYVSAQAAFQTTEQRHKEVEDVLRFGADHGETKSRFDVAIRMTRELLPNGMPLSNQLREKIEQNIAAIPADLISDVVTKMFSKGALFESARQLEAAAHATELRGFSELPAEAKSLAGALLDFMAIDRQKVAAAWGPLFTPAETPAPSAAPSTPSSTQQLFGEST
ncbi:MULTISPECIES: hypothetical protein [Ramlibacter]|uniref:Restriction endonuclease n=1 Tax=Ramlibacter pinisoli TaxID=2682844 RepID=A0A6N8IT49_9BURK|nr:MULTISPECIES: hypothetical protein [Ramlibacter]MBA2965042.1 hypothetical protein [Ramlibacter sp. CGMCC 1.13660]MVQ30007.1 hypothetical protein [Ramlibacter pinisoli]